MSQLATYLAAGAALGAASEATGTTAFTPLGEQARTQEGESGGRPPSFPSVPSSGGVSSDVLEQLAEAATEAASQQQQTTAPSVDLDLGGMAEQAGMSAETAATLAELRTRLETQQSQYEDTITRLEERLEEQDVPDPTEETDVSLPDWLYDLRDDSSDSSDDSSSDSSGDGFDLQDLEGRGPYGAGTIVAATGEAGAAAGDAVEESVGGLTRTGNTYAQAARAIAGKEYSAEDTLAESIHGTETRRINWDDYKPSLPDAPDIDLGSDDSSSRSSDPPENETLAEMTPGAEYLPGVETPDRSSDSSSDSSSKSDRRDSSSKKEDESSVLSLPEELKEKASAGGSSGGGLVR